MADVTITIPTPVLVGSEKFKTRYRPVPGAFGANTDRTNAPFTLTGLTVGQYELEVIFVTEDGIECPAILKAFEVVEIDDEDPDDPFECSEFTAEIRQNGTLYYIHIEFPTPVTSVPACGWRFTYNQIGGGNPNSLTVTYATLPSSGIVDIPLAGNFDTNLFLLADICVGAEYICFNELLPKIPDDDIDCDPLTLVNVQLTPEPTPGNFTLTFDVVTAGTGGNITILFNETSPLIPAGSGIIGTYIAPVAASSSLSLPFTGVTPVGYNYECIRLEGKIIDFCDNEHPFCVTYSQGGIPCTCI